jgi:hypothetical protein
MAGPRTCAADAGRRPLDPTESSNRAGNTISKYLGISVGVEVYHLRSVRRANLHDLPRSTPHLPKVLKSEIL